MTGLLGVVAGCGLFETDPVQSPGVAPTSAADEDEITLRERAEGYAILHDLLSDESNVSKLLIIKSPPKDVERIIHQIADAAKIAQEEIAAWFEDDDSVDLEVSRLPAMELRARSSIGAAKAKELILPGGDDTLLLLMSQFSALEYAEHLAEELADVEPDASRKARLRDFAETFSGLKGAVFATLRDRQPERE
jgi:hypothetical protein